MDSPFPSSAAANECVYLIKNGDLHKIGITTDFERRMRELKPDHVQVCLSLDGDENFTAADIERTLHARFKHLRIPQTEYFRLTTADILECCNLMKSFSDQSDIPLENYITDPESKSAHEIEKDLNRLNKKTTRLEKTWELAVQASDQEWMDELKGERLELLEEIQAFKEKHKDVLPLHGYADLEDCDDEEPEEATDEELAEFAELEQQLKETQKRTKLLQELAKSIRGR